MTIAHESPIFHKTRELCQTLLDQPETQTLLKRIESFLDNADARGQYETVMTKGQSLQQKQRDGQQLSDQEIADFEQARHSLVNNPVARGFMEAQEEMNHLRDSVLHYVTKTFELGRVPAPEDFESCGHGCSCSH
jgi:cell fate (sporulation/competence/biofilm development) regulator YlbF (YheA/YmcA/DUF963 family)